MIGTREGRFGDRRLGGRRLGGRRFGGVGGLLLEEEEASSRCVAAVDTFSILGLDKTHG